MFSNCGRSSGFAHLRRRLVNISSTDSKPNSFIVVTSRPSPLNRLTFSTAQLVRNSRYQQLAEGIERTDRRELERHQMGFAEWQFLQHGVRCLSVGHIQDEDDTRPVFQRIPL